MFAKCGEQLAACRVGLLDCSLTNCEVSRRVMMWLAGSQPEKHTQPYRLAACSVLNCPERRRHLFQNSMDRTGAGIAAHRCQFNTTRRRGQGGMSLACVWPSVLYEGSYLRSVRGWAREQLRSSMALDLQDCTFLMASEHISPCSQACLCRLLLSGGELRSEWYR